MIPDEKCAASDPGRAQVEIGKQRIRATAICRWLDAGRCVLPKGEEKHPDFFYRDFHARRPSMAHINAWTLYGKRNPVFVVLCGPISGGLEILDFDANAAVIFPDFLLRVEHIANQLPIVRTRSGGYHIYYLCDENSKSTKIASDADGVVRIESRGFGGLAVAPDGKQYRQLAGPTLPAVPRITPAERRELWRVARQFNELQPKRRIRESTHRTAGEPRAIDDPSSRWLINPSDDYAARTRPEQLLTDAGWRCDGNSLTRPGKDSGVSASILTNADDVPVVHIFTTSTSLEPGTYNAFELLMHMKHDGDFIAAIKDVIAQGYGQPANSLELLTEIGKAIFCGRKS